MCESNVMRGYLCDSSGRPFQGNRADPVGHFMSIVYDCPRCGEQGVNVSQSLLYLVDECIANGRARFPCANCEQPLTIPREIFAPGCLETLKEWGGDDIQVHHISKMSQVSLMAENWTEILLHANAAPDSYSREWTGKGPCPRGCGESRYDGISTIF